MALVMSRKRGEKIVISDCITVEVIEIRGDKVRLAVTAPKPVPVHREEVWQQIQAEHRTRRAMTRGA
jgi:carbon storage regulator